jgi:hypothetical protein
MRRFVLSLSVLLITCGCHQSKDRADYTRRAYHQQQREEQAESDLEVRLDQPIEGTDVVVIDQFEEDPFPRLPWESIEEWTDRLQKQLLLNHDTVTRLEDELDEIEARETGLSKQLQVVVAMNERLRTRLSDVVPPATEEASHDDFFASLPPPTFRVHLVKKGETLYSIAVSQYKDPGRVRDILLWNQGWLRDPHEMTAGLALVLFSEQAGEKNEQIVENYVGQWMTTQ